MADTDYDRMIRERYNALALRCDELTKEVERLKAEVAENQEAAEVMRLIRSIQLKASPIELRLECSLSGNWSVWDGGIWRRTRCTSIGDAVKWAENHCGITLSAKAEPDHIPDTGKKVAEPAPAAEKELADLRKDREAWDAVRGYYLGIDRAWMNNGSWQASVPNIADGVTFGPKCADPRDAVLALKAQLEGGK